MFRREKGSKRGSLPPKEGDLTCMYFISMCIEMDYFVKRDNSYFTECFTFVLTAS